MTKTRNKDATVVPSKIGRYITQRGALVRVVAGEMFWGEGDAKVPHPERLGPFTRLVPERPPITREQLEAAYDFSAWHPSGLEAILSIVNDRDWWIDSAPTDASGNEITEEKMLALSEPLADAFAVMSRKMNAALQELASIKRATDGRFTIDGKLRVQMPGGSSMIWSDSTESSESKMTHPAQEEAGQFLHAGRRSPVSKDLDLAHDRALFVAENELGWRLQEPQAASAASDAYERGWNDAMTAAAEHGLTDAPLSGFSRISRVILGRSVLRGWANRNQMGEPVWRDIDAVLLGSSAPDYPHE